MNTTRLEHIDLARALAVVSVIAYHFLRIDEIWGVSAFINTYFLSLFFFLSGLLLHPKAECAWMGNKAKRLLLPLAAFYILYIPVLIWSNGSSFSTTIHHIFSSEAKGGYWFVYTLFAAFALIWIIYYIYSTWKLSKWWYRVLLFLPWIIACVLSIKLPQDTSYLLSIPSFRRYYLFILLGMLYQKEPVELMMQKSSIYTVTAVLYILCTALTLWKFQVINSNIGFVVWMVTNIFGCLFIIETCRRICSKIHIHKLTLWLSQDSLGMYLGQFIIRSATRRPFMALTLSPYITFIPYTLVLLFSTLAFTRLLRSNTFTAKLFLGQ